MRYTPPPTQKIALSKQIKKSSIASAVLLALISASAQAQDFIYTPDTPNYNPEINKILTINDKSDINNYDNIDILLNPPLAWDRYTVQVSNGQSLTVSGNTNIYLEALKYVDSVNSGSNALHATGSDSLIDLQGNVTIKAIHNVEGEDSDKTVGANSVYADKSATILLGNNGTKTVIWAIGEKPDAISAKNGGSVIFRSTYNQLIGSVDLTTTEITQNTVSGTFSGYDSFWFGDEQSFSNGFGKDMGGLAVLAMLGNASNLDLTLTNGAQWSYFGIPDEVIKDNVPLFGIATVGFIVKRVSNITLEDGGIINLFDEDIQQKWKDIGLIDVWSELANVSHDYVRIGDLKGNNGIFRLDLNSEAPSQSDMVFIESSSEPGQHFIEPYHPEDLTSVSDTNRLTFALTTKDANSISFVDKQNIYGNSLFDYELTIDHETIDENNQELIGKIEGFVENYETFDDFDIEDYYNGTHWFIKRLLTKESAASIGMRSAGYASYDLAVNMDRRDRRLQNAVFQNEEKDGLWARVQYGEAGAEHLYNADLTTVYVGYEKATSADNRLGFSFAYTDGESDLNDLKGSGDLKRYEASVYDTLTFGSHYLDFVARFGQVDNEFDVTNQSGALTTSGSFDQKYAALSAEYGYNFKDEHNVFIEPQVQLQVAYLGDYNYRTERNMKVDADSDISVIGRVGLRTGKTFESSDYVGELYARADVLHQFTDGQDAQFSDLSDKVNVTWGNKDTWSTFGIGGYLNWKDNVSFQVDVERTAGGETIDTWLVSGRVNYLF